MTRSLPVDINQRRESCRRRRRWKCNLSSKPALSGIKGRKEKALGFNYIHCCAGWLFSLVGYVCRTDGEIVTSCSRWYTCWQFNFDLFNLGVARLLNDFSTSLNLGCYQLHPGVGNVRLFFFWGEPFCIYIYFLRAVTILPPSLHYLPQPSMIHDSTKILIWL